MPIDEPVARLWGKLLGDRDQNRFDTGVAATATVHGMVVATRNTIDFKHRGAHVLNPFHKQPTSRQALS